MKLQSLKARNYIKSALGILIKVNTALPNPPKQRFGQMIKRALERVGQFVPREALLNGTNKLQTFQDFRYTSEAIKLFKR
jgi:hypothetical protein